MCHLMKSFVWLVEVDAAASPGKLKTCRIHRQCQNSSKDFGISTQHMCFLLKEHVTEINYRSVVPSVSLRFQVYVEFQLFRHRETWLDSHSSGVFCVRLKLDLLWLHHTAYFLLGRQVQTEQAYSRKEKPHIRSKHAHAECTKLQLIYWGENCLSNQILM